LECDLYIQTSHQPPFHPPLPLQPPIENSSFTKEDTICVATDGSAKDNKAGSGVFFHTTSPHNTYARPPGPQGNYNGELYAALLALQLTKDKNITIYIDNKPVISVIEKALKGLPPSPIPGTESTHMEIYNIIEHRKASRLRTFLQYVYSHPWEKIAEGLPSRTNAILAQRQLLGPTPYLLNDGADKLTELLKLLPEFLLQQFTNIFNIIKTRNLFPKMWKRAAIFLLYKDGNTNNRLNYRPIALLPTLYKIYATLILTQLTQEVTALKALNPLQYGFRPKKSTSSQARTLRAIFAIHKHRKTKYIKKKSAPTAPKNTYT